jgi:hypothetical protein
VVCNASLPLKYIRNLSSKASNSSFFSSALALLICAHYVNTIFVRAVLCSVAIEGGERTLKSQPRFMRVRRGNGTTLQAPENREWHSQHLIRAGQQPESNKQDLRKNMSCSCPWKEQRHTDAKATAKFSLGDCARHICQLAATSVFLETNST